MECFVSVLVCALYPRWCCCCERHFGSLQEVGLCCRKGITWGQPLIFYSLGPFSALCLSFLCAYEMWLAGLMILSCLPCRMNNFLSGTVSQKKKKTVDFLLKKKLPGARVLCQSTGELPNTHILLVYLLFYNLLLLSIVERF